jgi:non-ribosomal peptide synthetase component F
LQILLHRLSGQDDIAIGIAVAEPAAVRGKNLLGCSTHLLPVRSRVSDTCTLTDHLTAVKQRVFDAYQHQSYALVRLIETLHLRQEPGQPPFISTVFNMDRSGAAFELYALEVDMFSPPSGAVECETFWNITDADNGLFVECYYNTDLFEAPTIRRWLEQYQAVLAGITTY